MTNHDIHLSKHHQENEDQLHARVANHMEACLGGTLPQVEIRIKNFNLVANIPTNLMPHHEKELPTLLNVVKRSVLGSLNLMNCINKKNQPIEKPILQNINAIFKPGRMTLILGPPQSGKSSLLKVLGGRFPKTNAFPIEQKGEITYAGLKAETLGSRIPSFASFIGQGDVHLPTLSVKETFEIAHAFAGGQKEDHKKRHLIAHGTEQELASIREHFQQLPMHRLRQFGLGHCQDTLVGDAMVRGCSGGEKKRVTTAEMLLCDLKQVILMDEISTGLDTAATIDIIKTQRNIAQHFQKTLIVSLLQPTPEVFDLFDDLILLNQGHIMYHGPRDQVDNYFQDTLGFRRPPGRDIADFLLDLGTPKQVQYLKSNNNNKKNSFVHAPTTIENFALRFQQTRFYQQLTDELKSTSSHNTSETQEFLTKIPEFAISRIQSIAVLFERQWKITIRNRLFVIGRSSLAILVGLFIGSMYFQMEPTDIQRMLGALFFICMFIALGQDAELPTLLAQRQVFYKQRGSNFFPTSSYLISVALIQFFLSFIEILVFGTITYFLCGFFQKLENFLIFASMCFLVSITFAAWFCLLTAISPNFYIAKPVSSLSSILYGLFSGFLITYDTLPDAFEWLYWINPMTWCIRALAINQYMNPEYDVCVYKEINYCLLFKGKTMGQYYLEIMKIQTEKYWIWLGFGMLIIWYLVFWCLTYVVLEYHRYDCPESSSLVLSSNGPMMNPSRYKTEEKEEEESSNHQYLMLKTPSAAGRTKISKSDDIALDISTNVHKKSFIPVTLAFQDIHYWVQDPLNPKEKKELLKGISGVAFPGTMTALMGASGAGKTTLMDVIAGRKNTGRGQNNSIQGKIYMNGYEATDLMVRRATGYCEQMDVHSEASTFREALTFSALLRQSSELSKEKKLEAISESLNLLGLDQIADQIIRGSSAEQRKRLTIGVELAAQPSVLFLDEPTSGLDARYAKMIMDGVRRVADSGRTVVCTIHQPSAEVFELFDSLLLLKKGGETVYFGNLGQDCLEMIQYFSNIPGTPELLEGYNPATWMLDVIGAGVDRVRSEASEPRASSGGEDRISFPLVFQQSPQFESLQKTLGQPGITCPPSDVNSYHQQEVQFTRKRAASGWIQFTLLLKRMWSIYWRTSSFTLSRIACIIVVALLFGLLFVSDHDYTTFTGVNSAMGMIYVTVLCLGAVSMNAIVPLAFTERLNFYRERACQSYAAFWYMIASSLVEIPFALLSGILFTAVYFPMVGFEGFTNAIIYALSAGLHVMVQVYLGELLVFILPSVDITMLFSVLLQCLCFIVAGYSPPGNTVPDGYKWLYAINPYRYAFGIAAATVLGECPTPGGEEIGCQILQNAPLELGQITVKDFLEVTFNIRHDEIAWYFYAQFLMIIALKVLTVIAMRWVSHQKR